MAATATVPCPGYHPRSPVNPLKEIVNDHLEELLRVYADKFRDTYGPLHPRIKDLFETFLTCGDPHFGFLRLYCPYCKQDLILPYSCKVRGLCPSCGQKRAIAWAERMVEEVLPDVNYAQIIFTIPKMLRKAFVFNRSLVGELCRVAYDAIRMFYLEHFPNLKDPVPAVIIAPQSFGSLLNVHVHLHSLVSLGVFDRQGNFHPAPDLDFSPLEKIFQELTFKMMLKEEAVTEERVALLQSWQHSGFHIDASRRVAQGNRDELERLLQYFEPLRSFAFAKSLRAALPAASYAGARWSGRSLLRHCSELTLLSPSNASAISLTDASSTVEESSTQDWAAIISSSPASSSWPCSFLMTSPLGE